jgi:hypothetical protein
VTYSLNKSIKRTSGEEIEELFRGGGLETIEPSPEVKAGTALKTILDMKLRELLLRIEIEPQIHKGLSFHNTQARSYENHVIDECMKDETYRKLILKETGELLKIFNDWTNLLFEQE